MPTAVRERRTRSRRIRRGYSRRLRGDQVCGPRRCRRARSCSPRRSRSSSCTSRYQPGVAVGFGSTTRQRLSLGLRRARGRARGARGGGLAADSQPLAAGPVALARRRALRRLDLCRGRLRAPACARPTPGGRTASPRRSSRSTRSSHPPSPLLLRRARDLLLPIWSLALWSAAATVVGIAQFFGADIFLAGTVGRRQASFLSSADFAALSGAALLVGIVALALPRVAAGAHPVGGRDGERRARDDRRRRGRVGARPRDGARRARRRARAAPRARAATASPRSPRSRASSSLAASSRSAAATSTRSRASSAPHRAQRRRSRRRCRRTRTARSSPGSAGEIWKDHPRARRRLGGLGGARELRAVPSRGAPALPATRRRSRSRPRRPTGGTASRTRGFRRSPTSA